MQLRCVNGRLAVEFDLSFAPGKDGIPFGRDSKNSFTFTVGSLHLVFRDHERV